MNIDTTGALFILCHIPHNRVAVTSLSCDIELILNMHHHHHHQNF